MTDVERARDRLVDRLAERERVSDERVLEAMRAVPRHEFVPESKRSAAYEDRPLPIGQGQTISAPHMVAVMLDLLDLEPGQDVLEIGTGCGYHAALVAEMVGGEGVYTVEYHDSLAREARDRLERLGYDDVSTRAGDGREGWPAPAPYDRAYLTCAPADFPPAVVDQVREGGLVLGPLGRGRQVLVRGEKTADGLERSRHGGVRFVEMR